MRRTLTISFLFLSSVVFAQVDSAGLKESMNGLNEGLVNKNHPAVSELLEKNCSYGHSNGWVQTKDEVLNDSKSGKLVYKKIENSKVWIVSIDKKKAVTRANTSVEGVVNGNSFQLNMHVMQIWLKHKNGWKLLARQSAKL